MKTPFLLCWLCPLLLNAQHSAPISKPKYVTVRNNWLLDLMVKELTTKNLLMVYRNDFHVGQVTRNIHVSGVRDTVLTVNTPTDKINIFKNKYNTYLISATITSQRLAFGRGIHVGTTKAAFCKAYGLNSRYNDYQIVDTPEGVTGIDFLFKNNSLVKVEYQLNYDVD